MHALPKIFLLQAALCWPFVGLAQPVTPKNTPVIGGPCEGCELVFENMPADLGSASRIASPEEPGEPLVLEGVVRSPDNQPAAGIVIYAYHTDAAGIYPASTTAHGRLRGWARTDDAGRYRFTTIRPGAYPNGQESAHIHLHVIEPGKGTYYIGNVVFDDDPLLTNQVRRASRNGRGGSGLTFPKKVEGVWHTQRDIILGKNLPE